ncbi:MAG: fumarylacetoacetate hydrolase family protein [Delftia acidovorans]|nr:fumarylacetoacetate hydrolase family protein [Delftia acidovorans]
MQAPGLPDPLDFAPWRLSGTVVGALLNHRAEWAALGAAVEAPPYKGAARAPVLQVKPRNTLVGSGAAVAVPPGAAGLDLGATLAIVIGRTACRVAPAEALAHVAGYTLAADLAVAQEGTARHYRPGVRWRARDGFCPLGPRVVPAAALPEPDALTIEVQVDGRSVQRAGTGERVRPVAALLAEVSTFMTLQPGDLLLLGAAPGAPRVQAGQRVALSLPAIGTLAFTLVPEPAIEVPEQRP